MQPKGPGGHEVGPGQLRGTGTRAWAPPGGPMGLGKGLRADRRFYSLNSHSGWLTFGQKQDRFRSSE